jgi:hypothetical protein
MSSRGQGRNWAKAPDAMAPTARPSLAVWLGATEANQAGLQLTLAKRLGMTVVDDFDWAHRGVRLEVLRMMRRTELHKIRPGISVDYFLNQQPGSRCAQVPCRLTLPWV